MASLELNIVPPVREMICPNNLLDVNVSPTGLQVYMQHWGLFLWKEFLYIIYSTVSLFILFCLFI